MQLLSIFQCNRSRKHPSFAVWRFTIGVKPSHLKALLKWLVDDKTQKPEYNKKATLISALGCYVATLAFDLTNATKGRLASASLPFEFRTLQ